MPTVSTRFNGTIPPQAKVHANGIRTILLGLGSFQVMATKILQDAGIDPATQDWVPLAKQIAALSEIRKRIGDKTMLRVGLQVPATFPLPPAALASGHSVLSGLDGAYKGAVQGGDAGCYDYVNTGERSCDVICQNPFPCPFDEGTVTGFIRLVETSASVKHDPAECRDRGGLKCVLHVSW
jgi:hypothetical protein